MDARSGFDAPEVAQWPPQLDHGFRVAFLSARGAAAAARLGAARGAGRGGAGAGGGAGGGGGSGAGGPRTSGNANMHGLRLLSSVSEGSDSEEEEEEGGEEEVEEVVEGDEVDGDDAAAVAGVVQSAIASFAMDSLVDAEDDEDEDDDDDEEEEEEDEEEEEEEEEDDDDEEEEDEDGDESMGRPLRTPAPPLPPAPRAPSPSAWRSLTQGSPRVEASPSPILSQLLASSASTTARAPRHASPAASPLHNAHGPSQQVHPRHALQHAPRGASPSSLASCFSPRIVPPSPRQPFAPIRPDSSSHVMPPPLLPPPLSPRHGMNAQAQAPQQPQLLSPSDGGARPLNPMAKLLAERSPRMSWQPAGQWSHEGTPCASPQHSPSLEAAHADAAPQLRLPPTHLGASGDATLASHLMPASAASSSSSSSAPSASASVPATSTSFVSASASAIGASAPPSPFPQRPHAAHDDADGRRTPHVGALADTPSPPQLRRRSQGSQTPPLHGAYASVRSPPPPPPLPPLHHQHSHMLLQQPPAADGVVRPLVGLRSLSSVAVPSQLQSVARPRPVKRKLECFRPIEPDQVASPSSASSAASSWLAAASDAARDGAQSARSGVSPLSVRLRVGLQLSGAESPMSPGAHAPSNAPNASPPYLWSDAGNAKRVRLLDMAHSIPAAVAPRPLLERIERMNSAERAAPPPRAASGPVVAAPLAGTSAALAGEAAVSAAVARTQGSPAMSPSLRHVPHSAAAAQTRQTPSPHLVGGLASPSRVPTPTDAQRI